MCSQFTFTNFYSNLPKFVLSLPRSTIFATHGRLDNVGLRSYEYHTLKIISTHLTNSTLWAGMKKSFALRKKSIPDQDLQRSLPDPQIPERWLSFQKYNSCRIQRNKKRNVKKDQLGDLQIWIFFPPKGARGSCEYLNDVFNCLEWRPLTWRGLWRLPPSLPWPPPRANRASGKMSQFLQCIIHLYKIINSVPVYSNWHSGNVHSVSRWDWCGKVRIQVCHLNQFDFTAGLS